MSELSPSFPLAQMHSSNDANDTSFIIERLSISTNYVKKKNIYLPKELILQILLFTPKDFLSFKLINKEMYEMIKIYQKFYYSKKNYSSIPHNVEIKGFLNNFLVNYFDSERKTMTEKMNFYTFIWAFTSRLKVYNIL